MRYFFPLAAYLLEIHSSRITSFLSLTAPILLNWRFASSAASYRSSMPFLSTSLLKKISILRRRRKLCCSTVTGQAQWLIDTLNLDENSLVVEICSNDGTLLDYFRKRNIRVLGIEPIAHIAELGERK
jgi:hypothetical protein